MLPNRHTESATPTTESQALARVLLIGGLLGLCWLAMQGVHELGHVLAARLTGGRITQVVLHPLTISRTDVDPNPSPRLVAWGGPLVGALAPLALWRLTAATGCSWSYLLQFFAGFCLVANGAYLGVAPIASAGDAQTLMQLGTPPGLLALFGVITVPLGLLLWHGEGRRFGVGGGPVNRTHAAAINVLFFVTVVVLLMWGTPR